MSIRATQGPLWDMFIIEIEDKVCFLAFSTQGQAFVDTQRHRGEAFGNGILLPQDETEFAFEALDALGLIARPL